MHWICDPGHSWLRVELKSLLRSGVGGKISGYSYLKGKYAYLEEDCDAEIYLRAVGKLGREIRHTHTNKDSRVRGYYPYSLLLANALFIESFDKELN